MVRPEGLSKRKMTPLGIEASTFWLVSAVPPVELKGIPLLAQSFEVKLHGGVTI
jgi:hypothetical protein